MSKKFKEFEQLDEIFRALKPGESIKDYDARIAKEKQDAAKNKDKIIPNRGAYDDWQKGLNKDKPATSNNANSTGQRGSSGGLTDAQLKALQDKVNADRRAGKTSDIRGGNDKVDGSGKPKTPVANTPAPAAPKPAPAAPAKDRMAGASKEDRMAAWAKANPKLAAAKAERDRTRGTSATTNPLMKDMKSRLPAPKPAANASTPATAAAKPAANVGAPGSQPKGEDLLTGPTPTAKPAATGAARPAAPAAARPAVTGAGNRTADLARARRQAMLKTVSNSPNAQRIAARNPMVQRGIAAERGAVNQSIRNSVARANTPANLNRTAPQRKVNQATGGVQSVGSGGAAKRKEPLFESKKTFSQFIEEAHNLNEIAPLAVIPLAMKLGSLGLGAYSAYQAGRKLKKGDYGGAALDAVGALPVGRVFGAAARGLGAGKKLQGLARFTGATGKEFVPNERTKLIDKAIDKGIDAVSGGPAQAATKSTTTPAATPKPTATPAATPKAPSSTVLARKGGVMGKLDKSTGKWTKGDWSKKETSRYNKHKSTKV